MKNLSSYKALSLLLFILPLVWTRFGNEAARLSADEIDSIFNRADTDSRDGALAGGELAVALTETVKAIFRNSGYYLDEEMINAIVNEKLLERLNTGSKKSNFRDFVATVPATVEKFRDDIFQKLLEKYDVRELMDDRELATKVSESPDTFGLTYSAYRVLFFDFEKAGEPASTYAEARKSIRDSEALNRDLQAEINRISETYAQEPILNDELIGGPGATGIETFAENAAHIPGKTIEASQTITEKIRVEVTTGNESSFVEGEARLDRKIVSDLCRHCRDLKPFNGCY